MHFQSFLIKSINDTIRPFDLGSKRYTCCINKCCRFIESRETGLCRPHNIRFKKGKDLLIPLKPFREFENCIIKGCFKACHAKGLCQKHYGFNRRNGDPLLNKLPRDRVCSINECFNKHEAKGYCSKHYSKFKKYGDPLFKKNEDFYTFLKCSINYCDDKYHAKSYCARHYYLNIYKLKKYYLETNNEC
jgi:hypothetical protein